MLILGCDPGATGALCLLNTSGQVVGIEDWEGPHSASAWLSSFPSESILGAVERVSAMPGQGVSSTFRFGFETGALTGVLACLGIPFELVTPQAWQKGVFAHTDGQNKTRSIQAAKRLIPSSEPYLRLKKHHGRADACLIAYWLLLHRKDLIA
ncbi:MAG: hypothetical protein KDC71_20355 [Acidobacteria bacterium]|nr:hypothetical protein [Acidobacteriota bacterium]MCB9236254.1 hypothetical protein [Bacteroidia bacterium]